MRWILDALVRILAQNPNKALDRNLVPSLTSTLQTCCMTSWPQMAVFLLDTELKYGRLQNICHQLPTPWIKLVKASSLKEMNPTNTSHLSEFPKLQNSHRAVKCFEFLTLMQTLFFKTHILETIPWEQSTKMLDRQSPVRRQTFSISSLNSWDSLLILMLLIPHQLLRCRDPNYHTFN